LSGLIAAIVKDCGGIAARLAGSLGQWRLPGMCSADHRTRTCIFPLALFDAPAGLGSSFVSQFSYDTPHTGYAEWLSVRTVSHVHSGTLPGASAK
jgi:hypothetical protein